MNLNHDSAGLPYRCCLCGRADVRCLCAPCRKAHTQDGTLAPWVVSLQNEAKRQTRHVGYWHGRVAVESLDRLEDALLWSG